MKKRFLWMVAGLCVFGLVVLLGVNGLKGGFGPEAETANDPTADTSVESLTALGQSMKAMEKEIESERARRAAQEEAHAEQLAEREDAMRDLERNQSSRERQWKQTLTSLQGDLKGLKQRGEEQGRDFVESMEKMLREQQESSTSSSEPLPVNTAGPSTGADGLVWTRPSFEITGSSTAPFVRVASSNDAGLLGSFRNPASGMSEVINAATRDVKAIVVPDDPEKQLTLQVGDNTRKPTNLTDSTPSGTESALTLLPALSSNRSTASGDTETPPPETVQPVYTIDANFTLFDARAMSSLIGRVPIGGNVRYPLRFKIVLGRENLAANGIELPGIEESVWSGYAFGDRTLHCVRGVVDTVSFVFADGRIVTKKSVNRERSDNAVSAFDDGEALGWISDPNGNCIGGEYVTNAPDNLTKMFFAGFASGASQAASLKQQTFSVSGSGVTGAVTGSTGAYVAAEGLASGFDIFADYLAERAKEDFDVVVAPSGIQVVINITNEIKIDYQTDSRKVSYYDAMELGGNEVLD